MLLSRSACAFMIRSMLALQPYSPVEQHTTVMAAAHPPQPRRTTPHYSHHNTEGPPSLSNLPCPPTAKQDPPPPKKKGAKIQIRIFGTCHQDAGRVYDALRHHDLLDLVAQDVLHQPAQRLEERLVLLSSLLLLLCVLRCGQNWRQHPVGKTVARQTMHAPLVTSGFMLASTCLQHAFAVVLLWL
jgi:hypothetical protein